MTETREARLDNQRASLVSTSRYRLFLHMTSRAVALSVESTTAIVTDAAELARVDFVHGDRYGPLLHLGEHLVVVALFAFNTSLLVHCAVEGHRAHGTLVEIKGLFSRNGESNAGA